MLNDKVWEHPAARWVALGCYVAGQIMLICLNFVNGFWPVEILGAGALLIWGIPVMWCAYKWSKS